MPTLNELKIMVCCKDHEEKDRIIKRAKKAEKTTSQYLLAAERAFSSSK